MPLVFQTVCLCVCLCVSLILLLSFQQNIILFENKRQRENHQALLLDTNTYKEHQSKAFFLIKKKEEEEEKGEDMQFSIRSPNFLNSFPLWFDDYYVLVVSFLVFACVTSSLSDCVHVCVCLSVCVHSIHFYSFHSVYETKRLSLRISRYEK